MGTVASTTDDLTKDAKLTGCNTCEVVHHSHDNTPKIFFVPGAQKHPRLETRLFKFNAATVLNLFPVYSKTQDAGKHPFPDV